MRKNLFVLLFAVLTFVSCSKKAVPVNYRPNEQLQEYIFSQFLNNQTPKLFNSLMLHRIMNKDGTSLYLFEKLYPACAGIIDIKDIYIPELDNGSWVDSLLFSMEEERFGSDVLSMLEDESNFMPPIPADIEMPKPENQELNQEQKPEQNLEPEPVEKLLTDTQNRLKLLEYGNERFLPVNTNNSRVLVHYSDKKAVRYFYDERYRLIKKEYWIMDTVNSSRINGSEIYEYTADSKNPAKKIIENDTTKLVSILNENGFVIRTEKYELADQEKERSQKTLSITEWQYDENNRVTAENCTEYNYDGEKYKGSVQKKQVFRYKKEDDSMPPDYEYYENNVLRTKTEYTEKDKYTTLIVFDEENSVKTYYENYIKVKDVFITGGVEKRVRVYE